MEDVPKNEPVDIIVEDMPKKSPMWLPEGSIRAVLALLVVGTTCFLIYAQIPVPDWWTLAFSGTMATYFITRGNDTKTK